MCNERKALTNHNDKQSTVYTAAKYFTKSIGIGEVVLNVRLNKWEEFSQTKRYVVRKDRFTK